MSERRAIISAWQSLSARPRSLMYSPLMHLVPVETQITWASFTSVPGSGDQRGSKCTFTFNKKPFVFIVSTFLPLFHFIDILLCF